MNAFESHIAGELAAIHQQGLHRTLRRVCRTSGSRPIIDGKRVLNCGSNDYLGLADHPAVVEAACKALRDAGAGSRASRLVSGSLDVHHALEESLARFEGTAASLAFSSGYATAVGTIPALVGPGDLVVIDRLCHACMVDGVRLSGARLLVFPHNDVGRLEEILRRADQRNASRDAAARSRTLIVTESVFSMDGDIAPLRDIVRLKEHYGAWLMVDEAHATGLYGPRRTGLAEELGVSDDIDVRMGTLGKALGAAGGYICGSALLIDFLVNRARSFMFSTAPAPAAAAAATAALAILAGDEGRERCSRVWANVTMVASRLNHLLPRATVPPPGRPPASVILPLIIGDEQRATTASAALFDAGVFIPAIRFPTVRRGCARLRLALTANHNTADIAELMAALETVGLAASPDAADGQVASCANAKANPTACSPKCTPSRV